MVWSSKISPEITFAETDTRRDGEKEWTYEGIPIEVPRRYALGGDRNIVDDITTTEPTTTTEKGLPTYIFHKLPNWPFKRKTNLENVEILSKYVFSNNQNNLQCRGI